MKKIISLLLSIIIVFSASCYSVNADELYCEYVDYPCYKFYKLFKFDEDDYNEELSQGVVSCSYNDGIVTIIPDINSDTTLVYFNIDGENRVNLLKAVMALQEEPYYTCQGSAGFISSDENDTCKAIRRFGLLDENLVTLSSSNGDTDLKPVMAKYLCISIKIKDANALNSYEVIFYGFYFEWQGTHEIVSSETDMGGYIWHTSSCAVCGYSYAGIPSPPNRHTTTRMQEVPASCSETGLSGGWKCTRCDEIVYPQTIIPKLPHNETVINNSKETYFTKGYTGDTVCADCGEVINKGKIIAKLTLKTPKFKLVKGKKKFTVKYTKVKDATGFQVRYRLSNKKWKSVKVDTKKGVTKVIKNLKKGKYQVRLRAFVKQNKKYAYSQWSDIKTVKVK